MQNLGDLFPDELKGQFADDNFKIGAVLKYHIGSTIPPKYKRLIIIGFDAHNMFMASVFINSQINPNIFRSPQARQQHLELDVNNRTYLDKISYVDCSQIKIEDTTAIKDLLVTNPSIHIGELSNSDLTDVLDKIKNSPTITPKEKRRFGLI
jgi:hypothetical protein